MKSILLVLAAIFITTTVSAQSGSGCCAHKGKVACQGKASVAATEVKAQADAPATQVPTVTTEALTTTAATEAPATGVASCHDGKAAAEANQPLAQAGSPCPNHPGCVCLP